MSSLATQLDNQTQLLARLAKARSITDDLFRMVRTDALYERPIRERHRIVFYIGHLEAFDWIYRGPHAWPGACDKEFDRLSAFGIDPVESGLPARPSPPIGLRFLRLRRYTHAGPQGVR